MTDVVVVGAGVSGLVCAQWLRQSGFSVAVCEKSRGLGGRMATRRWQSTWADHGVRCLENQGTLSAMLIQTLLEQGIIHCWTEALHRVEADGSLHKAIAHPRYAAANGISSIGRFLGRGLEIGRSQQVKGIASSHSAWTLNIESTSIESTSVESANDEARRRSDRSDITAKAVVLAIPAPQALVLLEGNAPPALVAAVRSVEFEPCITAIAAYPSLPPAERAAVAWQAVTFPAHADIAWVGLENSKRPDLQTPTVVIQSSADFAKRYLNADLPLGGQRLLEQAGRSLAPWLSHPEELQIHRWRYAFVKRSLPDFCVSTSQPLPLVCSGDWCGGNQIESAVRSGLTAAVQVAALLEKAPVAEFNAETSFATLLQAMLQSA